MTTEQKQSVSAVVWNWRDDACCGDNVAAEKTPLRRAGIIQAVVMLVIAAALYFILHHHSFARVVAVLGGVVLVLALAAPRAYRPIHRFGQWLGRVVGTALVYILLVPLYFLFFTPVALLLRLQKRDPLHRKPRAAGLTYWIPRRSAPEPDAYRRQFVREDRQARQLERPVGSDEATETGVPGAGGRS